MSPNHSARVLDWAPVLFCSRNNLSGVGNNPIAIATIKTVEFLDTIEISQLVSVYNNIVRAFYQ